MMGDGLFQGLPPPSNSTLPIHQNQEEQKSPTVYSSLQSYPLKSALKRPKFPQSVPKATVPEKRCRFKTMTDASNTQVIEAMQKISSHIKNPGKFTKASKLTLQLIQSGSVNSETSDYFFSIIEAAMSLPTSHTDPSVREDYHALISSAQDTVECLTVKQRNQLAIWTMKAVWANDFFTDDSFVFSKAAGRIKEAICNLPIATKDDDREEAMYLKEEIETGDDSYGNKEEDISSVACKDESDPFGLDSLIPTSVKKDEKQKGKIMKEEEETRRFLISQRAALIVCLEIAAGRYKTPWCQTAIDILVKHAFDNVARFTCEQRDAIGKLWGSVREQQIRRKQGKSVTGTLDMNGFEWLQQKYSTEKISIRHSVGGCGERRAEQWLG